MIKYIKYRIGDSHVRFILISSDIQRKWIEKFKTIEDTFKQKSSKEDIDSKFPFDNIKWLVEEGYSVLTLPKSYGGEGATIEDMVVLQSYLGAIDGAHSTIYGLASKRCRAIISTAYVESNYGIDLQKK